MDIKTIDLPIKQSDIDALGLNEMVYLSGTLYSARDAAHKRLVELIKQDKPLPITLAGQVLYYVGPTPARPGQPSGSAGPTTSSRMDPYVPILLDHGLKGMIGKGKRSEPTVESIKAHHAVYFGSVGGAGAYLANCITSMECVAFEDLGPEAIYKIEIKNFPVFVLAK